MYLCVSDSVCKFYLFEKARESKRGKSYIYMFIHMKRDTYIYMYLYVYK